MAKVAASSIPDELVGFIPTDLVIGQDRLICRYGLKDRPDRFVGCHDGVWAQEFNKAGQPTGWRFWRDPEVGSTSMTEQQTLPDFFCVLPAEAGTTEGTVGLAEDEGSLIISQVLGEETDVIVMEDHQVVKMIDALLGYLRRKHVTLPQ